MADDIVLSSSSWRVAYKQLLDEQNKVQKDYPRMLRLACHLTQNYSRSLGHNVWDIYECLFISALDCNQNDKANAALSILKTRFPKSMRVMILEGMFLEAQGLNDDALKLYNQMSENEPTNRESQRRKVAVYKSKGDPKMAIQVLSEFLSTFMDEKDGWLELCDLYISQIDIKSAGYCMEEMILTNPMNFLYHLKFAEICYTRGDKFWDISAKHYAKVLTLNKNCTRALYGLLLTLTGINRSSRQGLPNNEKILLEWVISKLKKQYTDAKNNTGLKMLQGLLTYFHY